MRISISVNELFKNFGKVSAISGLTTEFSSGMMHGVVGPSGAGKTTLARIITGLMKKDSGTVDYFEEDKRVEFSTVREKISYMPQSPSLYPDLSIDEHISFFSDLYLLTDDDRDRRREELLNITRLHKFKNRLASQLSGGMYKKLGLICSLLADPKILVLDEPTNGVDPISRREFWDLLYSYQDKGVLIIVTTAYMDEAERCSRTHLIQNGRLLASGVPSEMMSEQGVSTFNQLFLKITG